VWADLRGAARQLGRAPGFSLLVALVLALGIGVNVATFGVIDALLFRPPAAVRDPGGVRRFDVRPEPKPGQQITLNEGVSRDDVDAIRALAGPFARVAAYGEAPSAVLTGAEGARAPAGRGGGPRARPSSSRRPTTSTCWASRRRAGGCRPRPRRSTGRRASWCSPTRSGAAPWAATPVRWAEPSSSTASRSPWSACCRPGSGGTT
jgi:hypothetical protein